jgi:DNA-binding HxlR family transcriptional regulator
MSESYRTAPLSEQELHLMQQLALNTKYRATNLTSARLTSLEKRGYVERTAGRYRTARPTWGLTEKGRRVDGQNK